MKKIKRIRSSLQKQLSRYSCVYTSKHFFYYNGGYDQGLKKINLYNNPCARNPTFSQLISFLKKDKTDLMLYVDNSFVCADFAEKLHNNAEHQGLRCGYARVYCTDGSTHTCNAWNTADKGLVFTDSTGIDYHSQDPSIDCNDSIAVIHHNQVYECYSIIDKSREFVFGDIGEVQRVLVFW